MSKIKQFKAWLQRNRKSSNPVLRGGIRIFDACVSFVRTIKGLLTDKNARAIFYMKTFDAGRTHQTTEATCFNRYPGIFFGCKGYFGEKEDIRILSFGCSTGEEVVTLQQYFPQAEIIGAEINRNSLRICRQRKLGERIHFVDSLPEEISKYAPYDAIFCMAVFQRTPGVIAEKNIRDLKKIYPFEKFEEKIVELDSYLNEQGLMVVHMSAYDFTDTKVAGRYKPYGDFNQDHYGPYVFGRDSRKKEKLSRRHSIYIKEKS